MFANISILNKFRMNFCVSLLFFILIIGFSFFGFNELRRVYEDVSEDTVPDIVAILELKSLSKRLFAEIQGFIATMEKGEIDEFTSTIASFNEWMTRWKVTQSDTEELSLKEEMEHHKEVFVEYGEKIFALGLRQNELLEILPSLIADLRDVINEDDSWHTTPQRTDKSHNSSHEIDTLEYLVYKTMATKSSDTGVKEASDDNGKHPGKETDFEQTSTDDVHLDVQRLTSSIMEKNAHRAAGSLEGVKNKVQELKTLIQELIKGKSLITEVLEDVEDYEEDILATIDKLVALQNEEVQFAFIETKSAIFQFTFVYFLIGLLFLLSSLFFFHILSRSVTRPIAELTRAMNEVSQGNLASRATKHKHDELGKLSLQFNKMTESLEKLTVSRDFMDSILNGMTETLIVVTPQGIIRLANNAAINLLGYSRQELTGKELTVLLGGFDKETEGRKSKERLFDLVKINGKWTDEAILKSADGQAIEVLLSSSSIDKHGDNDIVLVATDIRGLKEIQEELIVSYEELKQTQNQLVQSSKLASIGELAAGVAHELNQPLMIIRTGTQLLARKRNKGPLTNVALDHHLESILSNSKRMMKIIEHLRTFARQSSVEFRPLDVHKAIKNCYYLIGEQFRLSNINIEEDYAVSSPHIKGDIYQLEQVFLNLLGNARDAIEEKRLRQEATDAIEGSIKITTRFAQDDPNLFEILFKDNGIGIPDGVDVKMFDPFFTTKEEGKGTGLGLSITYGIIKEHNGTIDISESSKSGTTLRIRLPITSEQAIKQV